MEFYYSQSPAQPESAGGRTQDGRALCPGQQGAIEQSAT